MDTGRNDLLGELATDAALERTDFLVQSTEQLRKFLDRHRDRLTELGGLTLIDDDPEYLSIAPDLTFRSRSRYEDPDTGEWVSETEVIETPAELVELYNPAELYAAFADAAREAAGFAPEPTATDELMDVAGVAPEETFTLSDEAAYAGAADEWAATQATPLEAEDEEGAARRLYDVALEFQERSQSNEARLIEQFEEIVGRLTARLGDLVVVDDEDERLTLAADGRFRAEVQPEDADGEWRSLTDPDSLVEFYDPTDVFGDLADALAEAFPSVAPELEGEDGEEGEDLEGEEARESVEDVEDVEDQVPDEPDVDSGDGVRP